MNRKKWEFGPAGRARAIRNVLYTVSLHIFKQVVSSPPSALNGEIVCFVLFDSCKLTLTFAGKSIERIDIEAFVRQF